MKHHILVASVCISSVGCASGIVTLGEASVATCSNPLSPTLCAAESTVEAAAMVTPCTSREQALHVNGCIEGRHDRVWDDAGTEFNRMSPKDKEAARDRYKKKMREKK